MTAARNVLRRLASSEEGATLVEFAFIAVPFLIILIGGFDLAHQAYARAIAQGALNDAARRATVQDPDFNANGATLEERIENLIAEQLGTVAVGGTFNVSQRSFFDFNSLQNPERITTDNNNNGRYDKADDDCFEDFNQNNRFDLDGGLDGVGGANDVVFYAVEVDMPRLFPAHMFAGGSARHKFTVETAVRNQPYADRPTPPIRCGV